MRMLTFAGRNTKEILRDPLNLFFGLGFPLVLIFLLSAIQANIPVALFEIQHLTPGITVFGLSFMTLFSSVNFWLLSDCSKSIQLLSLPYHNFCIKSIKKENFFLFSKKFV